MDVFHDSNLWIPLANGPIKPIKNLLISMKNGDCRLLAVTLMPYPSQDPHLSLACLQKGFQQRGHRHDGVLLQQAVQ